MGSSLRSSTWCGLESELALIAQEWGFGRGKPPRSAASSDRPRTSADRAPRADEREQDALVVEVALESDHGDDRQDRSPSPPCARESPARW